MADFKIDGRMKVKKLKELFKEEFGGTLRVYNGNKLAADDVTLASIRCSDDANCGEFTCRASRTVGKFCEELLHDFGIKVKVATPDDWVIVLDGITLATLKDLPDNLTRAEMEDYLSYKRSPNVKDTSKAEVEEQETSYDDMGTESNDTELHLKSYMSEDSEKFGFKNEDTDEMVIPCVYDAVGEFGNNGLAPVFWVDADYILHLEAFIDVNGDVQMYFSNAENSYNMGGVCGGASTFQNGFSLIQDIDGLTILSINGDKKLVNIPELEEEVNFEFMNNELEDFNASFDENGNIIIVTMDELYGVLNSDGELIIPCDYAELSRTETGFSACKEWGDEDKILFDIHGNQLN